MNRAMRKFYRRLNKMKNIGVEFTTYNGKIITTEEPENLNLPEGYTVDGNDIYFNDEKIGEFEIALEEKDDIDLDEYDMDDLSDKTIDFSRMNNNDIEDTPKDDSNTKEEKEDKEIEDKEIDEDDIEINEDLDIFEEDEDEVKENKTSKKESVKSFFKKIGNAIVFGVSKFFNHFGKRNHVEVPEYVLKDTDNKVKDEDLDIDLTDEDTNDKTEKERIATIFSDIEILFNKINDFEVQNPDLSFDIFKQRKEDELERYSDLFTKYVNGGLVTETDLLELKKSIEELKNEIEEYVNDNKKDIPVEENNKKEEKNVDKKEEKNVDKKEENKTTKFTFTSIEDTKEKFKEYDKPEIELKEIKEKIEYYEDFLKNHDLSHSDDQGMKQRMEEKLAILKEKYNEIMESKKDKNAENDLRSEKMAFYTQTAMGIDKAIQHNELERQIRLLRFKQDPDAIELDAEETRSFYTRKEELEALKAECLRRKAEVNKYYEEQAAKMTNALKR